MGSRTCVRISSGLRVRYWMPSSRQKSATQRVRSPSLVASATSAPRAIRAGAVSVDEIAQQRRLLGATQQISPAFFMQKLMALRHS